MMAAIDIICETKNALIYVRIRAKDEDTRSGWRKTISGREEYYFFILSEQFVFLNN